ncbi:hypothetical protein J0A71_06g13870 [Encephalitozoon cuniculi]|nr:hypothetical protein J0A71_06g13870 [Encephalitozoon cuniculi]
MEQAVGKLDSALECRDENRSEMVMDALESLVQISRECSAEEMAGCELDELFVDSFDKISPKNHKRLVEMLPDLVSYMRDPRNIYSSIERYFRPECHFSVDVAKVVFVIKRDFGLEFDGFLSNLFDCISPDNIEHNIERKLFFILMALGDSSVSLLTAKAFIKKLCSISLQMRSSCCHKILWTVLWIMRLHPMAYAMARRESFRKDLEWTVSIEINRFQPYLFELDILSKSLEGIRKVTGLIKREAMDAKHRPKLLSLANFVFPKMEI